MTFFRCLCLLFILCCCNSKPKTDAGMIRVSVLRGPSDIAYAHWMKDAPDIDGKQCPVPNYYFKVFVRTVKGNVRQAGDRLGDYPADQLKSIGFWVENAGGQGTARSWVKSVSEVENLTGFEFFPSVPAAVKAQKDAASWGL